MVEQSLVFIKPDAVKRALVGKVVSRFEEAGLKVCQLKMMQLTGTMADSHYAEHTHKPFYPGLKEYILSGPIVAMVLEGKGAIAQIRDLLGATDPEKAASGTIRKDFGLSMTENVAHASDSPESAKREIGIFFS